jgi:hypothetical protein
VIAVPSRDPPPAVAFEHRDLRRGFEVAFIEPAGDGWRIDGHTAGVEDGEPWYVGYAIRLDAAFRTVRAEVTGRSRGGLHQRILEHDGAGRWRIDGTPAPWLDGCLDVDLESSALTNAFPVRRLALAVGASAGAPAAWVRELDLRVERLEQGYRRLAHDGDGERYAYTSPDLSCELHYDAGGVVVDYPGIAARVALPARR